MAVGRFESVYRYSNLYYLKGEKPPEFFILQIACRSALSWLFYYGDIYEIFSNRFNNYFCNCQNYRIYQLVLVVSTQSSTYLLWIYIISYLNHYNCLSNCQLARLGVLNASKDSFN